MCGLSLLSFGTAASSHAQGVSLAGPTSTLSGSGGHAVSHTASSGVTAVPEDFSKLTLSSGFLLSMTVYDMPEISGDLRVDDSGNVDVPMAGELHVTGMTLPQAKLAIQQKLSDAEILKNPKINLDVVQYSAGDNVTVLGEVGAPGRVQLLAPHSLSDVLGMVGGETQIAGNTIEVRRMVEGNPQTQEVKYSRSSGNSDAIKAFMIQTRRYDLNTSSRHRVCDGCCKSPRWLRDAGGWTVECIAGIVAGLRHNYYCCHWGDQGCSQGRAGETT